MQIFLLALFAWITAAQQELCYEGPGIIATSELEQMLLHKQHRLNLLLHKQNHLDLLLHKHFFPGDQYSGFINVTENGEPCDKWNEQQLISDLIGSQYNHNYCR